MYEPIRFIGFFGPWDRDYWTVNEYSTPKTYSILFQSKSSYENTKSQLQLNNRCYEIYAELIRDKPVRKISLNENENLNSLIFIQKQILSSRTTVNKYPYEVLKPADQLPEDVNPERYAKYLLIFLRSIHNPNVPRVTEKRNSGFVFLLNLHFVKKLDRNSDALISEVQTIIFIY